MKVWGKKLFLPLLLQSFCACLLLLLSLCCGGASSANALAGDGISGTGDFELSKLSVVDETYGSVDGTEVTVSSLAPIIVARFVEALPPQPKGLFKVTLIDLLGGQRLVSTPGSAFSEAIEVVRGADHRDLYLHLPKGDGLALGLYELRPGGHYHFKVEHLEGGEFLVEGQRSPVFEGKIRVLDLTITYLGDFSRGDALVKDGDALAGVASLRPEFLIHSSYDFSVQERGPLSALAFEIFGSVFSGTALEQFLEVEEVSTRGTKISFYPQVFSPGMDLALKVLPLDAASGQLASQELPSILKLEFQ